MTTPWLAENEFEPERYEQWERPAYRFDVGRRQLLRALGGGVMVGVLLAETGVASGAPPRGREEPGGGEQRPQALGAWVRVGRDGRVTVYTGKVEVGQGIRTSLAQIVAEELEVPVSRIRMVMGDTALTPWDRGTHGSQSTPQMGPQLRVAAASARELLLRLAAARWGADVSALRIEDGVVVDSADATRRVSFGELARPEDLAAVVDEKASVRPAAAWKRAGRSRVNEDARSVVTGQQVFVSDIQLPGLLHGKVLRAPSIGAKLVEVDVSKARAVDGVTVVHDGDFVGVAAPDPHAAAQALALVEARWQETAWPPGEGDLFEYLERHPAPGSGRQARREQIVGSVAKGMRKSKHRLSARFTLPYIAHAPLEPRAAVAHWLDDKVLLWAGTQHPFSVRDDVAAAFGLPQSKVRLRVPATGSGYGGKHSAETAIEATRLAKAARAPVKVVWTREEEFCWAYFRPAAVMQLRAGLDGAGKILAWEHITHNAGGSAIETPYDVPNKAVVSQPSQSPARQGSYRALAATANCFARESFMDELAAVAGVDPLEFRRRHLRDERVRAVLDAAADGFGWGKSRPAARHGSGLAVGFDKGGYVSTCAQVEVDDRGHIDVVRLVTAFECGAIVNPDGLRSQVEGAVIMGLGGALWERIELAGAKVENARFSQYRVPRFADIPPMQTVLVDRKDLPSAGAGETPIIAVAPAIANAVAASTGKRLRALPLDP